MPQKKKHEKQAKEIAKLEDFVQRNIVRASTTKRAQARRKQLEKLSVWISQLVVKNQLI